MFIYDIEMLIGLCAQVGVDAASASETTYKNMLSKLPGGQDALHAAYESIEKIFCDVDAYVKASFFRH